MMMPVIRGGNDEVGMPHLPLLTSHALVNSRAASRDL